MNLTLNECRSEVGRLLSYGRNYGTMTSEQQADVDSAIRRGFRKFWTPVPLDGLPHVWTFSRQSFTFRTGEPYGDGTIAATGGVVTLTGGTWPTWADTGTLVIGSQRLLVASRTSGTEIVLEDADFACVAGTSYSLLHERVLMPADFGGIDMSSMAGPISGPYGCVKFVSEEHLRQMRQWPVFASQPTAATVVPRTIGNVTRWLLWFCPSPQGEAFEVYYIADPPDPTSPSAFRPGGGPRHAETLLAAILSVAEEHGETASTRHRESYIELLAASIAFDRTVQRQQSSGIMPEHVDPHGGFRSTNDIIVNL